MAETLDELVKIEVRFMRSPIYVHVIAVMQSFQSCVFIDRKHEVKKGVMAESLDI